ncbi:unnamed protein product [Brassicogethes aeneus]|uniref:Dynein attachment factor N-terminal domain-containing protein n=1 Tax=Brassicogethes aeneus TaxID=1431903 RepID=A0A9P0AYP1_BRAAE|nr:unnamed protein product [Brassicogethes aeneus]
MSKESKRQNKELFEHLQGTIERDKMHWVRNDAKIRACYTSKNYDEFREIVAAAHLKPLSKKDVAGKQTEWKSTDLES